MFEIRYKSRTVQTLTGTVRLQTELYRQSAIGLYQVAGMDPAGATYTCELFANRRGEYRVYNNPSWAEGTRFPMSWSIARIDDRYNFAATGFWHPAFDPVEPAYPLGYPVTSFRYHNDTTYSK